MADIELVIKIPEELYETYKGRPPMLGDTGMDMLAQSITNGTPLPKGHGGLIDFGCVVDAIDDWINAEEYKYTNATDYLRKRIVNVPTIIEEDKTRGMTCKEMNEVAKAFYDGFIEGMEGEE